MAEGQLKKRRLPKGRHLSVIKRERQSERRRLHNISVKSKMNTFVRRVRDAVAAKNKTGAIAALKEAMSEIQKAAQGHIIHSRNAARNIARLSQLVHTIS